MDLVDNLKNISESIPKQMEYIKTEEATKNAFVMPFLNALGYNVFDPTEVVPEFIADVGLKKGEKVDYAIIIDGEPNILIECKSCNCDLDIEHASQLYRYFSVTSARFGVLTNGISYKFYTDIEEPNKMDDKPFFEFNMDKINEVQVNELKKFMKSSFNLYEILTTASNLKYTGEIKKIIAAEINNPSEDFVKFFAKKVYSGLITEKVRLKFVGITKTAMNQFIKDQVSARLKSALEVSDNKHEEEEIDIIGKSKRAIVTTEDEWEGYYIVRAILHEIIDINRVLIKDTLNYCAINLDNTKKPICRLYFNSSNKRISLFDNDKQEEKFSIENLKDIYNYSDRLKATIKLYDT